jgi:hypothetical protein
MSNSRLVSGPILDTDFPFDLNRLTIPMEKTDQDKNLDYPQQDNQQPETVNDG